MIKKITLLGLFVLAVLLSYSQDNTLSFVENKSSNDRIKIIADSINKPILITSLKLFSIGSSCIVDAIGGSANDRNVEGNSNNRNKLGNNNERNNGGNTGSRRKQKGKHNNRNKDGDSNNRNKDGDASNRNKYGSANNRNNTGVANNRYNAGMLGIGSSCAISKKGKLILYTRFKINAKKAQIFYHDKYFSNRYFKIKHL